MHVLMLHGWTGSGPQHWQRWLAAELVKREVTVDFPDLPAADTPSCAEWLAVLRERMASVPPSDELVVVTHSLGSVLWFQHASSVGGRDRRADRVLLVAAPSPSSMPGEATGFTPVPLDARGLRRAAGVTRMVAGEDDHYCSQTEAKLAAEALGIELDVIPGGEHLNVDAGYGSWPSVLEWVLTETTPIIAC